MKLQKPHWGWRCSYTPAFKVRVGDNGFSAAQLHVLASDASPTVSAALRTPDPHQRWWKGSSGILERAATLYDDFRLHEGPPMRGWKLISTDEAWEIIESMRSKPKELSDSMRLQQRYTEKRREFQRLKRRYYYWHNKLYGPKSLAHYGPKALAAEAEAKVAYFETAARTACAELQALKPR